MKKFFIYFIIIFVAVIFQVSVISVIFNTAWLPDIVLSMILAWSLIDGFEKFFPWSIFSGFLYDAMTFSTIGTSIIIFAISTYAVSFFSKRFSTEIRGTGFVFVIFFVFSATIGSKIITSLPFVADNFSRNGLSEIYFLAGNIPGAFFWNMIFFTIFFYFINRIKDFFLLRVKTSIIVK